MLDQGAQVKTNVDQDAIFYDQASWARFYTQHVASTLINDPNPPSAPVIDFSKQMVVVSLIYRPTGGYSLTLDHVVTNKGQLTVTTTEHRPGPNTVVTQGETQPFIFAAVPRQDGQATFIHNAETNDNPA